jgi:hypothetical protein
MPIRFAAPCNRCGSLHLEGTCSTCTRCTRYRDSKKRRWRTKQHLRCDFSKVTIAVSLVWVGYQEEDMSEERLPLCRECLEIEKETQSKLDRLGSEDE